MSVIITCNAGSTNTKFAAYDESTLERKGHAVTHTTAQAMQWLSSIGELGITAIGHRVVHGGLSYTHPERITDAVREKLESYIPLAPLHQPAALHLIAETRNLYPGIPMVACFDTAFHHTMGDASRRLPLPRHYHDEGIMRYGFHGLSYEHVVAVLPSYMGEKANGRIIIAHLGGGSSACAVSNRKSVASTMGFSTLDGMMMGTRCGALDPGVLLYLLSEKNMPVPELSKLLYHDSGLKGVSGISGDMQELLASENPAAQQAVALYGMIAAREIAGLWPSLGGLDALIFTGGIGENAVPVRDNITKLLRGIGDFAVHVIPTDEEQVIAQACKNIVAQN